MFHLSLPLSLSLPPSLSYLDEVVGMQDDADNDADANGYPSTSRAPNN